MYTFIRIIKPFFLFLFVSSLSNKIIKNENTPACRNCKFYKPQGLGINFDTELSKCEKFGEKNIYTNKIEYRNVDSIRQDETKCGLEGKYFEKEENIDLKKWNFYLFKSYASFIIGVSIITNIILITLENQTK